MEGNDEFAEWFGALGEDEQSSVIASVDLLQELGVTLPFPYSSDVRGSRYGHMRELRIQHRGRPYRVLYAFDPRRAAILLVGGDKTGDETWYDRNVPKADFLYEEHLAQLKRENLI